MTNTDLHDQINEQNASIGHNSGNLGDIDAAAIEIGNALGDITKLDEGTSAAKDKKSAMQKATYEKAHAILDTFGLDVNADSRSYNENAEYFYFRQTVLDRLTAKLKDKTTVSKTGAMVYSDRVKKQWSRLISAYKRGDTETQSSADVANKAAAKERANINTQKAVLLDAILDTYGKENPTAVEVLIRRAMTSYKPSAALPANMILGSAASAEIDEDAAIAA